MHLNGQRNKIGKDESIIWITINSELFHCHYNMKCFCLCYHFIILSNLLTNKFIYSVLVAQGVFKNGPGVKQQLQGQKKKRGIVCIGQARTLHDQTSLCFNL